MKQVIKRVLKGLLPNRFLNAYRHVENLGAIKEQINSIIANVNSILWQAERVMSINELFVETPKEKVEGLIKSLHPIKTEHELVRWGSQHDGGYLIPKDFKGIRALFSPGVGNESAFEEDFYRQCKLANHNDIYIYIYMADKSVNEPILNIPKENYSFIKKFIGCTDNEDFITLDTWVNNSQVGEGDLMLQMDIEGGEYLALISASDTLLNRFRIIALEIHLLKYLWDNNYFEMVQSALNKILKTHYCVHLHPNNCCAPHHHRGVSIVEVIECTFIRKDRVKHILGYCDEFPHPLDADNVIENPTLILPRNWYGG
ncbi:FkbM family methyltransferase [Helicobacter pylori]|nr:FkbM family methyltransferase [Helicobacter pylori]WJJ00164.1 FkbM family methyltransferase [Helicobacter pylori]WJJ05176.1 FkbM family methyltransferase [Helicobacter pylori]